VGLGPEPFKVVLAGALLQEAGLYAHYVSEAIKEQVRVIWDDQGDLGDLGGAAVWRVGGLGGRSGGKNSWIVGQLTPSGRSITRI
jgi:hypothetical protein